MGRFKKDEKPKVPSINTGSMSDIIFMFLFFFMVITTIREATLHVRVVEPVASEVQRLERKALVSYIYVGPPINVIYGTEPRIQLNDVYANLSDVGEFITIERLARNEIDRQFLTTSLKVDKNTRMGIVTDIKQELRYASSFRINYATRKGEMFRN